MSDSDARLMTQALILRTSGQDGAYPTRLSLPKCHAVYRTTHHAQLASFGHLGRTGVGDYVRVLSCTTDLRSAQFSRPELGGFVV